MHTGSIPKNGRRCALRLPPDAHVHIRVRLLPSEEQSERHLRGQPAGPRGSYGEAIRVP